MTRLEHPLLSPSLGSQKTLVSFQYGDPQARPKVYIQASLHAEELPGMLVAHHLRSKLVAAEAAGQIQGEVVLVPVANPIGLAQDIQGSTFGRFDMSTGLNFNRQFKALKAMWWRESNWRHDVINNHPNGPWYGLGQVNGGFIAQPVRLGRSDGKRIEVLGGLKAGMPYASTGSFVVKSELGKGSAEHTH